MTQPGQIQMIITFDVVAKTINVSGPIQDKILSLGMLEMAKLVVINQPAAEGPPIIVPKLVPPTNLKGGN